MTLTKDHIQDLYKFTRAHYVEHYDLQTELVDHLANGIEKQWAQNPNLSFEEAKQKEFKKFGVFGFMDVVAERQKALSKTYQKIILRFYKEFFTLPKVMLTFGLTLLVYLIIVQIPTKHLTLIKFIVTILAFIPLVVLGVKRQKELKKKEKKMMLEEMLLNHNRILGLFLLPFHYWNMTTSIAFSFGNVFISAFITAFFLLLYIVLFVIPSKAEQLLAETYPEYKFQQKV